MDNWRQIGSVLQDEIGQWNLDGAPEAKRSDVPFMGSMGVADPRREEGHESALPSEEVAPAMRMGKGAGAAAPASQGGNNMKPLRVGSMLMHVKEPSPLARPVLRLVMGGRGMSTAQRRQRGRPAPAVLRPTLLVIVGGRHATSP